MEPAKQLEEIENEKPAKKRCYYCKNRDRRTITACIECKKHICRRIIQYIIVQYVMKKKN